MRLPVRYSGPVQVELDGASLGPVTGAVVPVTQRGGRVGELLSQATHEGFLPFGLPLQGVTYRVTWAGRVYVPVGETVSLVPQAQLWRVRLVDFAVFYAQSATTQDGATVRLHIVARGVLTLTAGSGLQDVQGSPNASHVGFVEPGVRLHGGDVITLPSGDSFTVVPPLQHDLLGDTVGLSWQGEQSVFPVDPDPTPDEPGTPVTSPGDDSWWNG